MELSTEIMSDIITHMKYAKYLPEEHRRETFEEIVTRNKEMHIKKFPNLKAEIDEAYELVYQRKILPSGRSLQFAGKAIEMSPARIYNCSALAITDIKAFSEIMYLLLMGTGTGYSIQKHHVRQLPPLKGVSKPTGRQHKRRFLIQDSIVGWADAVRELLESHFYGEREIDFDFRDIRKKGSPLKTSGGHAPGPEPLRVCLLKISSILENAVATRGSGTKITTLEAHDIICHLADAVLCGGIRRSATIALFSLDDEDMLTCKYGDWWEKNPQRGRANNSVVVDRKLITKDVFESLWKKVEASGSGEPGIFFTNDTELLTNPCFTGDMQLRTADGFKTFKELDGRRIDIIDADGKLSYGKVWESGFKQTIHLVFDDGSVVKCTPDHKFMGNDTNWYEAKDLLGKGVYTDNRASAVVVEIREGGMETVYDFTVPTTHSGWLKLNDVTSLLVSNCAEISLQSFSFCNLSTINATSIVDQDDFNLRAKMASRIATLQAAYTDFYYLRKEWRENVEDEALIGVSITGVADEHFLSLSMKEAAAEVMRENEEFAAKLGINKAARTTAIKPEGTASLVLGTSSGVHAWYAQYYWRRISVGKDEPIYAYLRDNHPELLEDDYFKPTTMAKIKVPMKAPEGAMLRYESALDTLERVKRMNLEWIQPGHREGANFNNTSCTISVRPEEWKEVGEWMWNNRDSYTGIAVLPYDGGTYTQSPFEECTKEEYDEAVKHLTGIDLTAVYESDDNTNMQGEVACGGGACEIK